MKSFAAACAVITVVMLGFAAVLYRSVRSFSSWTTAPGAVVASGLRHTEFQGISGRPHLALVPDIRYEYEAGGYRLTGHRLSTQEYNQWVSGMDEPPGRQLSGLLAKYPVGARVTVHYNPSDPAASVIEIDRSGPAICLLIAAAAFIVSVIGFFR